MIIYVFDLANEINKYNFRRVVLSTISTSMAELWSQLNRPVNYIERESATKTLEQLENTSQALTQILQNAIQNVLLPVPIDIQSFYLFCILAKSTGYKYVNNTLFSKFPTHFFYSPVPDFLGIVLATLR